MGGRKQEPLIRFLRIQYLKAYLDCLTYVNYLNEIKKVKNDFSYAFICIDYEFIRMQLK